MEGLLELSASDFFCSAPASTSPKGSRVAISLERLSLDEKSLSGDRPPPIRTLESTKSTDCSELMSKNQASVKGVQTPVSDSNPMMTDAWENLRRSLVYFRGKPVGTIAASDSNEEALNYNQVFVRDFVPSALAFLMNEEPEIVKNFLLKTLYLQGWEKRIDCFTLGEGSMRPDLQILAIDTLMILAKKGISLSSSEVYRKLFCHDAFRQPNPFPGSEDFVNGILERCQGFPFHLEVWGKHVRDAGLYRDNMEGRKYWQGQLERFRDELPHPLSQKSRPIYESLNIIEKILFLDICCFLVGEDKDLAVSALEGLHYKSEFVQSLCNKSLIRVDDYDLRTGHEIGSGTEPDYEDLYLPPPWRSYKIIVKDEVRLLARDLAQEEFRASKRLRLSCVNDLDTVLILGVDEDSSIEIRGIRMSEQFDLREAPIRGKGVRLFVLDGPIQLSSFFGLWDVRGQLVWLRLRNFNSTFPSAMKFFSIRILQVQCHGDHLEQKFRFLRDWPG